jgi:uncharacterized metal-binding protein
VIFCERRRHVHSRLFAIGTAILLGLTLYIGESLDKRNPNIALLDGCTEGCAEGCFDLFISSMLHI